MEHESTILIVDDEQVGRDILHAMLVGRGYKLAFAHDGKDAIAKAAELAPDLILLDVMMPGIDGFEVCRRLRADPGLVEVPVIMVTTLNDRDSRLQGIEAGADDFVSKPFDKLELQARIRTITRLNRKRKRVMEALQDNMAKTECLLLNILPGPIAERLKKNPGIIADRFDDVTVLFADIVGFTKLTNQIPPAELVALLNEVFSSFDELTERYGLEKIKTIGDKYMVAGGLPIPRPDHAEAIAEMALDMKDQMVRFNAQNDRSFRLRIGINTGPVIAGVIGVRKFIYDLWGDTVNIASRMETYGLVGYIQVTAATRERLQDKYVFERRGKVRVKNGGEVDSSLLMGRKAHAAVSRHVIPITMKRSTASLAN